MSVKYLHELIALAESQHVSIGELILAVEQEQTGRTRSEIMEQMEKQFTVMESSAQKGVHEPVYSRSGLTGGDAYLVKKYIEQGRTFVNPSTLRAMSYALSVSEVNAGMGCIVATPTAGSAGILPGVLVSVLDSGKYKREDIVSSLLTAAAVGLVIANSASIAGATGGCQAEVGSATAMAAAALVEIGGGSPQQVGHAVGLALKNSLGLVCDPVAGLVEIPCIIRNGLHAITALAAADMALAGVKSVIPPDEVIQVMRTIGQEMPLSLRETGIGGLASTPTGIRLRESIFGKST